MEETALGGPERAQNARLELLEHQLNELRAQNAALAAANDRLAGPAVKTPAPPVVDPELAGARLAQAKMEGCETGARGEGSGVSSEPALTPGAQRLPHDVPVETQAHQEVIERMREAQAAALKNRDARLRERRRRGLPADEGRYPIEARLQRRHSTDWSAMVDGEGNDLREPGYVYRWIRQYDVDPGLGRQPNSRRAWEFKKNYGAEVVKEPVYIDGKPTGETRDLVSPLGVALRYPVEEYAQRVIDHSPYGAFDAALDKQTDDLFDYAERENSQYGKKGGALQVFVPEGHGDRSVRSLD